MKLYSNEKFWPALSYDMEIEIKWCPFSLRLLKQWDIEFMSAKRLIAIKWIINNINEKS